MTKHRDNINHYDAIIVGASIAGCICALELANKGWRVAVLEKRQSLQAYKKICTHIIHPYGINQLKKFGIYKDLLKESTLMTGMEVHHDSLSVLYPFAGKLDAANIERHDLDPALRTRLTKHHNISLLMGFRIQSLIKEGKSISGAQVLDKNNELINLYSALIIGADGRNSAVLKLANGTVKKTDNKRVALFSYFSINTPLIKSHVWALKRGQEYIGLFPNQNRVLISWYLPRDKYESKKETHEQSFAQLIDFIAKQGIEIGERQESIMVVKDSSPQSSHLHLGAVTLIGDAKLSADPLTGIGCTWAMQSAKLLTICLGKPPSNASSPIQRFNIQARLALYSAVHALIFKLPSAAMTIASMHGKWIFNHPIYRMLAWITGSKK